MNNFFTLLCKLITLRINGNSFLPAIKKSSDHFSGDVVNCKGCPANPNGCANDEPCKPATVKKPERSSRFRFNIFSSLQINLAPVAVERPAFAYITQTNTTTQTNRMKQVLRAAKSSTLCFVIILMSVFAATKGSAQTTLTSRASGNWETADIWVSGNLSGTISSSTASSTVTGSASAAFLTQLQPGAKLYRTDGTTLIGTVLTVNSNTSITLTGNAANLNSNVGYITRKVPAASDPVIISSSDFTITVNALPGVCGSLTLTGGGASSTLTLTNTLTVAGNVSIGAPTNSGDVNLINVNASTLTVGGNLDIQATTSGGGNARTGQLSIGSGTVNLTGNLTSATNVNARLIFTGSGNLNIAGAWSYSTTATFTPLTGTVNYNGSGAQTIAAINYFNLTSSNTGARTLASSGTIGVAGTFTPGTNVYTIAGSTVNFNGANGQTIPAFNYNNLSSSNNTRILASSGSIGIAGTFTAGSGTYTTTGSTIDFNGTGAQSVPVFNYNNLAISGARTTTSVTLANGGTISIPGIFSPTATFTSGNYIVTNNTINFSGATAQTIPAFNYNNLTSSSTGSRTLSGIVGVAGTFTPFTNVYTVTGSTINFNGSGAQAIPAFNYNNLTSSSTGARTLASTGTVGVAGTFTPGTNSYTIAGSTIDFNGSTGTQTVPGFTYNNLTVSNASGASLGGNATVNAVFTFAGIFPLGTNSLTIASTGSITNSFSSSHYIKTDNSGQLKMTVGTTPVLFPVGNTSYNPITLANTPASDVYGIKVIDGPVAGAMDNTKTIQRAWQISEAVAGGSNLSVKAQYNTGEEGGNFIAGASPYIGLFNGTTWTQNAATEAPVGTFTSNTNFTPSSLNGSQYFALGKDEAFLGSQLSDIITNTYTYTQNVPYASFQTVSGLTSGATPNSVGVMGLVLRDGGAAITDGDGFTTQLTNISFSVGTSTAIRTAALFDPSTNTNVAEVAVNGATSFSFSGLTITAADNSTKNFELRVTYQSAVTDNQQIIFSVSSATALGSGSLFTAANAGNATSSSSGDDNKLEVTGTQLTFITQPSTVNLVTVMTPAVSVKVADALGNIELDPISVSVQVTVLGSTFDPSATTTVNSLNGVATFNNLIFNATGTNVTLTTSNVSALADATSTAFDVIGSASSDIVASAYTYQQNIPYATFQSASGLTSVGTPNSVGVLGLTVRDGGASLNDFDTSPTILNSISFSTGGSTAIRTAALFDPATNVNLAEVAVNGATTISFTGLTITTADNTSRDLELRVTYQSAVTDNQQIVYTVTGAVANGGSAFATANAGGAVSSNATDNNRIEVTATKLSFVQQPSNANVGATMTPAVTVEAIDAIGNRDLDYGTEVDITSTGTLTVTPAQAIPSAGLATFSGLVHSAPGTLTLTAASTGITSATSNSFVITFVASSSNYFRSKQSGAWNDFNTWESSVDGNTYFPVLAGNPLVPTTAANTVIIQATHTVTVSSAVSADQVTVNTGGILGINSGQTLTIANGTGTDLTVNGAVNVSGTLGLAGATTVVNGTLKNSSSITGSSAATLDIAATGLYDFNLNGGAISTATWDAGSTIKISGFTNANANTLTNLGQAFSNFIWDCPGQSTQIVVLQTNGFTGVSGTMTVNNTGTGSLYIPSLTSATPVVVGNYVQTGGTVVINNGNVNRTLTVTGNFTLNETTTTSSFQISASGASGGSPLLNVGGNFTMSAGTITRLGSNSTTTITFNGSSVQTFSKTGGVFSGAINFSISNGATVDFGTSIIDNSSSGTFLLNAGAGIITANSDAAGALTTSGTNGSIQVSGGRTYTAGANYTFNGAAAQSTGNGLAASVNNLTINNSSNVTLTGNTSVAGTLNLLNGKLITNANTITVTNTSAAAVNRGVSPPNNSRFVVGNLKKSLPAGSNTRTFEVGGSTYAPVDIAFVNVNNGAGGVTVFTVDGNHPNLATSAIDPTEHVTRYWSIANNGTTFTAGGSYSPTFNYDPADVAAGTSTNFSAARYNGTAWSYPTEGAKTATSTQATGITTTDFGTFAVGALGIAPTITTQPTPSPIIVCEPGNVSFTAAAFGFPAASVEWQFDNGGGFTALTIAAPYSVVTTSVSGTVTTVLTINPATVALSGNYRVVFTNSKGSATTNAGVLTVNPAIANNTITPTAPTTICSGTQPGIIQGGIVTGGNGTYTYQWQSSLTGAANNFSNIAGATAADYQPPVLSQTTYYLRIVTSGGCSSTSASVQITVNPAAIANAGPSPLNICTGATAQLNGSATGASSTTWTTSGTGSFDNAGILNAIYTPTQQDYDGGSVTLTLTTNDPDGAGPCVPGVSTIVVNFNPGIQGNTITPASSAICTGSAPVINGVEPTGGGGTGSFTYLWESSSTQNGTYTSALGANTSQNYNPGAAGNISQATWYRRKATSAGCVDFSASVQITMNPLPTQYSVSGGGTVCAGSTGTTVNLSNSETGFNYNLTLNSATVQTLSGTGTGLTFTNINQAGTYTVIATNATTLCSATMTGSAVIAVNPLPTVTATSTPGAICPGGSSQLSASSNLAGTQTQTNNTAVTIPDNSGTGVSTTVTVSGLPTSMASVNSITVTVNVSHSNDGDVELYLVRPGGSLTNTASGQFLNTTTTGQSIALTADIGGSNNNFTNTVFSDAAAASISTGNAPFTGNFKPLNAFSTLTGNPNGVWTLKALDDANSFGATGTLNSWSITFTYDNGTYTWTSNPAGFTSTSRTATVTPSVTTVYTIQTTDGNGCSNTSNTTVTVIPAPVAPSGTNGTRCQTGTVVISATPGAGETIDWYAAASGGAVLGGGTGTNTFTTGSITAGSTTTFYAQARNTTTGCISPSRTAVTATAFAAPSGITITGGSNVCANSTIQLGSNTAGGVWSSTSLASVDQNGLVTGIGAGTAVISYTVTNANNCATTVTKNVTVAPAPSVQLVANPTTVCLTNSSLLTAHNSGGTTLASFTSGTGAFAAFNDNSSTAVPSPATFPAPNSVTDTALIRNNTVIEVRFNIIGQQNNLDIYLVDPTKTRSMLLMANKGSTGGGDGTPYDVILSTNGGTNLPTGSNLSSTTTYKTQNQVTDAPPYSGAASGGAGTYSVYSPSNPNGSFPPNPLLGAPVAGTWQLIAFDDSGNPSTLGGAILSWTMTVYVATPYTTVFSGPGTFGTLSLSTNDNNANPSIPVTPQATGSPKYYAITTDAFGCSAKDSVTLTVNEAPTVTASDIVGITNNFGLCGASVTMGSNVTATGTPTPTLEYRTGGVNGQVIGTTHFFNVGTTAVTVIATNSCSSVSQTFNVVVSDNEAPAAPVLSDVTGECSASATAPIAQDNCAGPITGTTNDPLAYNTQGTHVIHWSFDDGHGNVSTANQNVVITDITAPVLPTLTDVTGDCTATATAPVAIDNCAGPITGTTNDPLTYNTQGTHVIHWSFDDGHGNVSATTQNVVIADVTAPVAPTLTDVTGECSATATAPIAQDACVGPITATTNDPLTYNTQGTHVIHWSFDDGRGNVSTANQNVIIADVTAPVAPTLTDVTGECSATATAPVAQDACVGPITGTTNDPLTYSVQGNYIIHWSFNDGRGNISTTTQNVIIADATAPSAPVLADVTGECSATATAPVATDCAGPITGTTEDPLTYNTQGTYVIHWSFDDGRGNISTATQNVIVADITAPVAPTLTDITGQCTATATAPVAQDACVGPITGTTVDPLTYNAQGSYVIHWSFNDGRGNISTAIQNVIIADASAPVAPTLTDVTAECSVTVTAPVAQDCAGPITGTTEDPLTYNSQGTYVIHWSFDDGRGNVSTATQNVIIADITAPVVPTLTDVTGQCSATVTAPIAQDACVGPITGTTVDPLTYNAQGSYVIHWSFNDGRGNISTTTQNVIIADDSAPTAPVLADVTGECSATATAPVAQDCAGPITGTTEDPLTYNTQGTYIIHWSFDDGRGNVSTANQNVIVADVTAPVVPILTTLTGECTVTATAPIAQDACVGPITGTTVDPLTYSAQGSYVIHWSFNDGRGNISTTTQDVTIADATPPVAPTLTALTAECTLTATAPVAQDACAGPITGTTADPLTYSAQGSYVIHWSFNDGNGNISTATQNVTIADVTAPVAPTLTDVTGECSATATAPVAQDACAGPITGTTSDPLTYTEQGNYIIHWSFNDGHGNTSTALQNVIVADDQNPTIVGLPANFNVNNDAGICGAIVNWTEPTSDDNCSGSSILQTAGPISGSTFPAGTTTVTYTATDAAGNTHEESFTVTVTSLPISATLTPGTIACNGATTTLTVSASGGSGSFSYKLDNGTAQLTNSFTTGAGNHSVVITDLNNCTLPITKSIVIAEPTAVTGVISGSSPICFGSSATLTLTVAGGGTINGTLSDGTPFTGSAPTITVVVTPAGTTTYTIATLSDEGCSATAENLTGSAVITVNPLPTVGAGTYADVCNNGGLVTLNGSPANGTWSGSTHISGTTFDPSGLAMGDYTLTYTYTDGNGCTNLATATIHVNAAPVASITNLSTSYCENAPAVTLTGLPAGGTFTIDGTITTTSFNPAILGSGDHTVVYSYSDGTCTGTATQIVTVNAAPAAPASGGDQAFCEVSPIQTLTAQATAPAGSHVVWYTTPTGNVLAATHSLNSVNTVTYYAASVNDITGCESMTRTGVTLTIYPAATALPVMPPITAIADEDCSASSISFIPPFTISEHCSVRATGVRLNALGQIDPILTLSSAFPVGTTTIRWEASVNGQTLTTLQQVIVEDKTAPVPNVTTLSPVLGDCSAVVLTIPTATDNCAGTVSATTSSPLSYTTPGTHTIIWVYADGHGNTTTQTQDVIIADTHAPVPNAVTLPVLQGQCSVVISDIPKATDNCAGTIIATTNSPLSYTVPGTYTIVWIYNDGNGNVVTQPQTVIVDGLQTYTVTGGGNTCSGGGVSIGLSGSNTGVTYQLFRGTTLVASLPGSDGADLDFGQQFTGGTYTVKAVAGSGGCILVMSGSATIVAGTPPQAFTVTGGGAYCSGPGVSVGLSGSVSGVSYQLVRNNTVAVGSPIPGNSFGLGIDFGLQTGGVYTVMAINNQTGCTGPMTGSVTVNAGTLPVAYNVTGGGSYCTGTGVSVGLEHADANVTYYLVRGGNVSVTSQVGNPFGFAIDFGLQPTGTYTVMAINNVTGCINTMTGNAVVSQGTSPVVPAITGATTVCVGSTISLFNTTSGGTWTSDNGGVASVDLGTGVVSGVTAGTTTIRYSVTNTCGATEKTISITVTAAANAGVINGFTSVCTGSTITLTSTGTPNGTWSSDNSGIALVDATTGVVTGVNAGNVNISYTVTGCGTASISKQITVNGTVNAGVISGGSSICAGSPIAFSSNGTPNGTWGTEDASIATVNGSGVVTGVNPGTTNITYTVTGCGGPLSVSKSITVTTAATAGSIGGSNTVCVGLVTPFTSSGTGGGVWSSDNTNVALVDATTGVVTGVNAGSAIITYAVTGCGSFSTTKSITVTAAVFAGTINGASSVCAGSATSFTSSGSANGVWSSDNTAVAIVDGGGVVTALTAGNATIKYTVTGCGGEFSTTKSIQVNAVVNAGTVSGGLSSICAGSVTAFTSNGTPNGVWSSDDINVATVNASNGVITGVGTGTANITYTVTGCGGPSSSSKQIAVSAVATAGTINGTTALGCPGTLSQFTLTGATSGGVWASSNTSIVTVSNTGLVTCEGPGSATITYSVTGCGGPQTASFPVTVTSTANPGLITGGSLIPLCPGTITVFTTDGTEGGTWSSSNPAIASVNATTGEINCITAGNAMITYTVNGCTGPVTSQKEVSIAASVTAGTLSGATSVCAGSTMTITRTGGTANGVWTSNNTAAATVNSSGVVTGVAAGNATITYTVSGCNIASTTKTIQVNASVNAGALSGSSTVCVGSTIPLTTNGQSGGTWSSSNTNRATVTSGGIVKGISAGSATISYTLTGCGTPVAQKTVSITATANAGSISSGTSTVCAGSTIVLTSSGTAGGAWSSGNTNIATVTSNGNVTGVGAGTVTITYTVGCNNATATKSITVTAPATAGTLSGANNAICTGATLTFTTSGTSGGTWSSSNTAVATVNGGVVTGVSAGTADITYSVTGCSGLVTSAPKTVTVNGSVTAGTLNGATTVCAGSTIAITNNGGSPNGVWSSNSNHATVNNIGVVTGVSAGNVIITYTVTGCNTASVTKAITVNAAVNAGTISGASSVCVGATTLFTTNGQSGGAWSSSNTNRATVTAGGSVKGISAGSVTISYTLTGCGTPVAQKVIQVNANANAGSISGASTVCIGSTIALSSNGTSGGTWSSNSNKATVNSSGIVTGVSAGSVTITYSVTGCSSSSTTKTINVVAAINAGNTQIGSNSPVCTGSTISLTAGGGSSYSWSGPAGFTSTQQNPVINNATAAKSGTYTVIISNGGCTVTKTVNVTVASAVGGTVLVNGAVSTNTCFGNTVTVSITGQTGGVTRWEYSTTANSWQTINTTATTITRTITANTAFRAIVAINPTCSPTTSSVANVTVTTTGIGGTVAIANTVVCTGSSAVFTLSGNTGSVVRWEYSLNGGSTWTTVSPNNTSNTLTYSNATQNRRYRAVVRRCTGNSTVNSTSAAITVVNCNTRTTATEEITKQVEAPIVAKMEIAAYPNPSQSYFNLQVKSSNNADVDIKVYDIAGKQVAQMRGAAVETYRFGNTLVAGVYIIEVRQGNERITTKVIKQ